MESLQLSQNIQFSRPTVIGAAIALATILLLAGVEFYVAHVGDEVDALRGALTDVQDARGKLRQRQVRKEALARRYGVKAPALGGFLQQAALKQKLDVSDSVDQPEVPIGKKFVERGTTVHLKKSGMYAIGKFMESIEQSNYPIAISKLNIRKRSGEPDSYDVEVSASAYDRVEAAAADSKKQEKP